MTSRTQLCNGWRLTLTKSHHLLSMALASQLQFVWRSVCDKVCHLDRYCFKYTSHHLSTWLRLMGSIIVNMRKTQLYLSFTNGICQPKQVSSSYALRLYTHGCLTTAHAQPLQVGGDSGCWRPRHKRKWQHQTDNHYECWYSFIKSWCHPGSFGFEAFL